MLYTEDDEQRLAEIDVDEVHYDAEEETEDDDEAEISITDAEL